MIFGKGANSFDIEAGTTIGAVTEQAGERNMTIAVAPGAGQSASVDITKAETHQVTSLTIGAGGTLQAAIDPTFAVGASNPTAIFDTTVHAGQTGPGRQGDARRRRPDRRLARRPADRAKRHLRLHPDQRRAGRARTSPSCRPLR